MVTRQAPKPDRVFVGPFQFDIVWSTKELRYNAEQPGEHFGLSDARAAKIWIADEQSPAVERDTLLHEILHGCLRTFGLALKIDSDEEERIVATLSPVLLGVLRDNLDLVRYLTA